MKIKSKFKVHKSINVDVHKSLIFGVIE